MKYIGFVLGDRTYGLPMCTVREITRPLPVTELPGLKQEMRGLVNLRGRIIALLDPFVYLGGEPQPITDQSKLFILRTDKELPAVARAESIETGPEPAALLVGGIQEVFDAERTDIVAPPAQHDPARATLLSGVAKLEAGLITLLSPAGLLRRETKEEESSARQ